MSEIYAAVKNIIVFMLLLTVIMNLLGKSGFKQYIRIFAGLVLILIVIKPALSLMNAEDKVNHYFDMNYFKINASDITGEVYNAQEKYQGKVLSEYKEMIQEQINTQLSAHDLEIVKLILDIESDASKTNCGQILRIDLMAKSREKSVKQNENSDVDKIDEVAIDKIEINRPKNASEVKESGDQFDTVLELTVKQGLVSLYGVNIDNISVKIVE